MDWAWQGAVTAAAVVAVLAAAQRFAQRGAGLLAGLPLVSGPALVWMAHDHGARIAAHCAAGSIVTATVAPVFAGVLAWLAAHLRLRWALPLAVTAALALAAALRSAAGSVWAGHPGIALACAGAAAWSVQRWLGHGARQARPPAPARPACEIGWTAVLAGVMSASLAFVAPHLGGFWSGAVASLPLISGCVLLNLGRRGAVVQMREFAAAYAPGAWGTATFACVFGLAVTALGPALATLVAVAATGGAVAAFRHAATASQPASCTPLRGQVFGFGERAAARDLMRAQPVQHRP